MVLIVEFYCFCFLSYLSARRLERIIKDVLDEFAEDKDKLASLLTGRRVDLAEESSKDICSVTDSQIKTTASAELQIKRSNRDN